MDRSGVCVIVNSNSSSSSSKSSSIIASVQFAKAGRKGNKTKQQCDGNNLAETTFAVALNDQNQTKNARERTRTLSRATRQRRNKETNIRVFIR